jgi:hypothetical protein
VVKGRDLLDGHLLAGRLVYRRARGREDHRSSAAAASWESGGGGGRVGAGAALSPLPSSLNLPDYTVCSLTNDVLDVILLAHIEGDLAGARGVRGLGSRHDRCCCCCCCGLPRWMLL